MKGGQQFFKRVVEAMTAAGRKLPLAHPERHGVELTRNLSYCESGIPQRVWDVYRPQWGVGLMPAVLYLHGGGFRYCSKETHWMMALGFALQGFTVFNVDYRLAPQHPYPAAFEDACAALAWLYEHAESYGVDPSRIVVAGESAGANLATGLAIATSYPRAQPAARALWNLRIRPSAIVALCGMLQVSNPERITDRKSLNPWVRDRILEPALGYAPRDEHVDRVFLDPLLYLEAGRVAKRKLPPFLVSVGTRDPMLDDSRRLAYALENLGVENSIYYYPGALHAFQAMIWSPSAKDYWRKQADFLDEIVGPLSPLGGDFVSLASLARVLGFGGRASGA